MLASPRNRMPEFIDNIEWAISTRKDKKTRTANWVKWVMKRFIPYMWDAVFNGYPIKIVHTAKIYIDMEPIRGLSDIEKKFWLTSEKCLDYIFRLRIESPKLDEYTWIPSKELLDRLQETINSDMVYKFIKK